MISKIQNVGVLVCNLVCVVGVMIAASGAVAQDRQLMRVCESANKRLIISFARDLRGEIRMPDEMPANLNEVRKNASGKVVSKRQFAGHIFTPMQPLFGTDTPANGRFYAYFEGSTRTLVQTRKAYAHLLRTRSGRVVYLVTPRELAGAKLIRAARQKGVAVRCGLDRYPPVHLLN